MTGFSGEKQMRHINETGLGLIKHFESLELKAYQDSVRVWTIGWGHTREVQEGMEITEEEAIAFLREDLQIFEQAVERNVEVELDDNQFSALVSFTFNLGEQNLKVSTLLRKLNEHDYEGAAAEFKRWNKAGGVRMAGLVRRRLSERNLFNSAEFPIVEQLPDDWEERFDEL